MKIFSSPSKSTQDEKPLIREKEQVARPWVGDGGTGMIHFPDDLGDGNPGIPKPLLILPTVKGGKNHQSASQEPTNEAKVPSHPQATLMTSRRPTRFGLKVGTVQGTAPAPPQITSSHPRDSL